MIHRSAIIDEFANVHPTASIWHWTHICSQASIGERTSIGQNCYVAKGVQIGSGCRIQNNVSIYERVAISDFVFCGPSVVFTNVINPRAKFPRKQEFKSTFIGEGVSLGANSTIVCGISIDKHSFVAAGSVVTRSFPPFSLLMGVPARRVGWFSHYGERIPIIEDSSNIQKWICPHTGRIYTYKNGQVISDDE